MLIKNSQNNEMLNNMDQVQQIELLIACIKARHPLCWSIIEHLKHDCGADQAMQILQDVIADQNRDNI